MKNAHLRFGKLAYVRRTEKTATNIRVLLDAFVGEERGKAHLVSAVGGDTEIGALAAAFANGDRFTVIDPDGKEGVVSLGERPLCFRGSIMIAGRKRPLRHLVSCSQVAPRQAHTAPSGIRICGGCRQSHSKIPTDAAS